MAQHVIDTFPTYAHRTHLDGSTEEVDVVLGTGHDDAGRALFGEVAPEVRGHPREFTHRTYLLDENLDLRGMSQRGLLLDAGGPDGTDRLVVPPGRFGAALSTLDAPVAALRPGSRPTISHGAVGPRTPSDVLERDDASGSVRVIDPSPSTQLSREEGTCLSADVWFDAAGGIDLDRTGYVDGDVRRLSAGTVRDWMDDRAAGPVEAARIAPEEARAAAANDATVRAQVEFEEKVSRRENAVAAETPYDPFDAARDAAMDPPGEDPSFDELVVLEVNAASRDGDDARRAQIFGLAARQATAEDYIDQRNPHHPDSPALAERVRRSGLDAYDALYTRERIAEVSLTIADDLKSFGIADPVAQAQKQSMSAESSARAVDRLSSGYEDASSESVRQDQFG